MSKVKTFRKKPVEIQAIQFTLDSITECILFCKGRAEFDEMELKIHTLEGVMAASLEDWIIQGVMGEVYPCKPHIFNQTYELVE